MFKNTRLILALFISSFIFSCTRSFENKSNVTLSFANLNQVGAMTCTTCLKSIIIKVEGNGFDKIVTKLSSENIHDTSEISASDFTFNLPPGTDRKFKVVAIYILNQKHILAYGESSVDLPDTTPKTVEITMENKGEIHGGSLVGRYITGNPGGTDSGPTGSVDMTLNYNSDPDFDIFIAKSQILNGWFDFMASENLEMTYKVSGTGQILFEKKSLNILRPLSGVTPENHVGRLVRPGAFYLYNGSTWDLENEKHDILYGFFGEPTYLTNKHVCFEDASLHSFSNLRSTDNTTALTYSSAIVSDVYRIGGTTTNDSANCPSYETADRYKDNKIYINKEQLDGKGNDTAKGFGNAFSYIATTTPSLSVQKYHYFNGVFSLKTLPGLFGPTSDFLFNDIKLYKKSGAVNGGFDDLQCTQEWLDTYGFSPVSITTQLSADNTTISISNLASSDITLSDGTIACPTKLDESEQPQLQTHGGFYLGKIDPATASFSISGDFTHVAGAPLSSAIMSNSIYIYGVTSPVSINISGDGSPSYSIDGGTNWLASASTISADTSISIKLTSANTVSTLRSAILNIDGVSKSWNVTTLSDPCLGSPSPGTVCAGGAIYLGSLNPGATTGLGIDNYMTTAGGLCDIPAGSISGGSGTTSYANADFTPASCSGTDTLTKTWNDGTTNWYDIPGLTNFTGTTGSGYGNINTDNKYGDENASNIVTISSLAEGGPHAAARYCDKLNFGGFTDWYLPNRYELNLMYANKISIPGLDINGNYYWSSTEKSSNLAWYQKFDDGYQSYYSKDQARLIRCVRRF